MTQPLPSLSMTDVQREIVLLLAQTHIGLGRSRRGIALATMVAEADGTCVRARRLLLRGYLALGHHAQMLDQIDRLVEHEFDSAELAFALAMQCRALHGLGQGAQARDVWGQFTALCRTSGLDTEACLT